MEALITNFIILCFVLTLVFLIWFLWLEIQRQKRFKSSRTSSLAVRTSSQNKSAKDSSTKQQLIRLFHGDRHAVERLINAAKQNQPNKPEKWYEEKVLYDLDRDRR